MSNFLILVLSCMAVLSSCKKPDSGTLPEQYYELDKEVSKYFADFEVGDCWVYEDSVSSKRDTIELISKMNYNSKSLPPKQGNPETNIEKYQGWALHYKPKLSREFKVYVNASNKGTYFHAKIHAILAATGGIDFVKENGEWHYGAKILDSVVINKHVFYNVLPGTGNTVYMRRVFVNEKGIVSFISYHESGGIDGIYYLISKFKK